MIITIILGLNEEVARILIPTFVTIFLFFLGHLIVWVKNKIEKQNESISYRELIIEWINLVEDPIKLQIEWCKNFSISIGSMQELQPVIIEYNSFQIEKIESIPIERYINTFVLNTNGSKKDKYIKTYDLISQFDYLKKEQIEMLSNFEKYHSISIILIDEWNSNFFELDNIIMKQSMIKNANTFLSADKFHDDVLKVVLQWRNNLQKRQSSVLNSKINLIEPLLKLINIELEKVPLNDYAFNLDACLQKLLYTIRKLEEHNLVFKNLFYITSQDMLISLDSLIRAKVFFRDKTKIRCFITIK